MYLVTGFVDVSGKKVTDFNDVPICKDQKELDEHVLEVIYKYSKFIIISSWPTKNSYD